MFVVGTMACGMFVNSVESLGMEGLGAVLLLLEVGQEHEHGCQCHGGVGYTCQE